MAVPTITSITPDSGLTLGRNQVEIIGTNFAVPVEFPETEDNSAFQSIKVFFGALQSPAAFAITATRAVAIVPTYLSDAMGVGGDAVDVTLYNLDEDGVEVPGESVVEVGGYTYTRPTLTDEQAAEYVIRRFVSYLRRHIIPNVWITMDRQFPDELLEKVKCAELPLIWINGVDWEFDPLSQQMGEEEVVTSPTDFKVYRPGTSVMLAMPSIHIYSRAAHPREIYALAQSFLNTFRDVPHLYCDPYAFDTASTEYAYPLMIPMNGAPSFELGPENDGLKICTVGAVIEEVDLNDLAGTLVDIGWTVENDPEIILTASE